MLVYCWPCICRQDGLTHPQHLDVCCCTAEELGSYLQGGINIQLFSRLFWFSHAQSQEWPRHGAGTVWVQAFHIPQWDLTLIQQEKKSTNNPHWLQILLHHPFSHPRSGLQKLLASNRTEHSVSVHGCGCTQGVTNHILCPLISYALAQFSPLHPPGGLHTALSTEEEKTKHWVQSWATISCSTNCFPQIPVLRLIAFSGYEGMKYNHWGMLINCFFGLQ